MNKKKHTFSGLNLRFFSKHISRPWFMAVFAVVIFLALHTLVFAIHSSVVYRYDSLYQQIQNNGATIQMPEDFLRTRELAHGRSFFSRPDILAEEIGMIQSGIRSMVYQYKNDIYRLHDTIVQQIKYLSVAAEAGEELMYPGQTESSAQAAMLQKRLDTIPPGSISELVALSALSTDLVETTQKNIAYAQRKLILQDILSFKHEMLFLADMYRTNPMKTKTLDIKRFWNEFSVTFSRVTLKTATNDVLKTSLQELQTVTMKYREDGAVIRANARERRASWVETENKKWEKIGTPPPVSPMPDSYSLIYISLAQQMMYVYEDNELILSTLITSGRDHFETIRGTFHIYTKQRFKLMKSPFPDQHYELWVDYWLGFHDAYGIHDTCNSKNCWRTKFGVASYTSAGSHGCINTPYNAVKFIYNWAKIGTTVYVK